ncbi:transposase [Bacillus subtilis subsp. subtilis]|nr:transposase [Bacillus subtilis subsp. subtilis]
MASPRLQIGRHSEIANIYVVTTVTHSRLRVFEHANEAAVIVETLHFVERTQRTCSLAWVVMPDHVHWMFHLRTGTLSSCVQLFKSRSSRLLNAQRSKRTPLWQAGYFDHAVRCDESLRRQATYIAANPVRAGLSRRLGEYPHAWCRWPFDG